MNPSKLFSVQDKLDERIKQEHGLEGQDLLDKKILALQVELGELANEARFFKFWSHDQEPNRTGYIDCDVCTDQPGQYEVVFEDAEVLSFPCPKCEGHEEVYVGDRLLEEYVDCFHFILSIWLELGIKKYKVRAHKQQTIVDQFIELNYQTYLVLQRNEQNKGADKGQWYLLLDMFVGLGEMLGFTWNQIEQAYLNKNKINFERQNTGY